ncbi:protein of unknown function DUF222 [Serinicoccus hydrothermalis]|uniref:DUF222 domain-containing protein n=1 Tax=Serinicoccus hydrothermalis TaxID=1758689 RepID=A0A1B1NBF8_9MICO|nr:protein of unknown function DUF222 [Serinicoccus hydrothermalis]
MEAAHLLVRRLEGARVHGAGQLAARAGEQLLERQGVSDPGELSRTARERWRARAKSVTAVEISTLTGLGRGAARQLVAVALAPASTAVPVRDALAAGVATWDQVEHFWRQAGLLPHEDAGNVAHALFATRQTVDRARAAGDETTAGAPVAMERLDPEGEPTQAPWGAKQFVQALAREVARARAVDPEAETAARARRHRERTAYGVVDDDGTGRLVITGDAVGTAACTDRLHVLAKRARAAGDERTESQLRSDIARALLLHGTLPLPTPGQGGQEEQDRHGRTGQDCPGCRGQGADVGTAQGGQGTGDPRTSGPGTSGLEEALAGLVTPEEIASLAQVLAGAPTCDLQVVVPLDALAPAGVDTARRSGPSVHGAPPGSGTSVPHLPTSADPDAPIEDRATLRPRAPAHPGVGRVAGRCPHFLTPGAIGDLLAWPGTTLHRLLTDPADGRCVERTVSRYQPDAAMRAQVTAADLLSRAPDGTLPVRDGQLDHVHEYLLGGPTSETNLQGLDTVFHALKTHKFWTAQIDATRNVTWTSLFGRHYTTRPHDYRQYLAPPGGPDRKPQPSADSAAPEHIDTQGDTDLTPEARRHLASLLVYAALARRPRRARLESPDDDPDSDAHLLDDGHRIMWVRHTRTRDGRKITGPHPATPTPDQLLDHPREQVLRADHWTDPITDKHEGGRTRRRPADIQDEPPPF